MADTTAAPATENLDFLASLGLEVARHVTLPFFIIDESGVPAYIQFDSKIEPDQTSFSERVNARRKKEGEDKPAEPMNIANITNLRTGELMRLVSHTVLTNIMAETYPSGEYVGKKFRIVKTAKKGGRGPKYFAFDVAELRPSNGTASNTQNTAQKPAAKR